MAKIIPPAATDGNQRKLYSTSVYANTYKKSTGGLKMAYFESKNRTVFSPQCEVLEPVYKMLEQYEPAIGGSQLFEDMIENYEYLDFVLRDKEEAK